MLSWPKLVALCAASALAGAALLVLAYVHVKTNSVLPRGITQAELEAANIKQLWLGTAVWKAGGKTHIGTIPVVEPSHAAADKKIRRILRDSGVELVSLKIEPADFQFVTEAYRARVPSW